MHRLPAGIVTFLFTDIEGSTRLWERDPEAMARALDRHDGILRQAIEAHGGYIFKTVGDALYAAFDGPQSGVLAAIQGQRQILTEPWEPPVVIRVRMAIHSGVAEQRGGDYIGPTLNHCARLLDVVWARQIVVTEATYELVVDLLPPDVTLRDLGQHRLTDLRRAEHLYQVMAPGLPSEFPELRSLDALPNNLPVRRSTFVGREKAMAQIQLLMRRVPLLTLIGPGGTGKTRLALQVGAALLPEFRDGVWFVEFASLADPELVASRIAGALHLGEEPGRTYEDMLIDHLRGRQALLILDNCEHLIGSCARIAQRLLESCPELKIMATSREPLGIEAETYFDVPGLSLVNEPVSDPAVAVQLAMQSEAVRLFVERARAVAPGFELDSQNVEAVMELCRRLDGLPLAIELAAARIRLMSPVEILARLDDRFSLLAGGLRTAEPRQQTLRATLDWSHDLLSAQEQTMFRRLAVFRGGWSLAAAEAVVTDCGSSPGEVLDLLTGLVAKSMIKVFERGNRVRYGMLLTMQDYAAEKLEESGEGPAVRDCHAAWFLLLAERSAAELAGPDEAVHLEELDLERDNLRAAFAWSWLRAGGNLPGEEDRRSADAPTAGPASDRLDDAGRALASLALGSAALPAAGSRLNAGGGTSALEGLMRLALAMLPYWERRAWLREGQAYVRLALGVSGTEALPKLRANLLVAAGSLALQTGDYAEAQRALEEGLQLAVETGDLACQASALANLGTMAQHHSDFEAARRHLEQALGIRQAIGDTAGVASVVHSLGIVAREQGEYVAARSYFAEALGMRRHMGDQAGISASLNALATLSFGQGQYDTARELFLEALALSRSLGDQRGVAFVLNNLGRVTHAQGDLDAARAHLQESLALRQSMGDRRGTAATLNNLGQVALAEGNLPEAWRMVRQALAIRQQLGDMVGIAESLEVAGQLYAASGDPLMAVYLAGVAELLRQDRGAPRPPHLAASMSSWLGRLRADLGSESFDAAYDSGCRASWREAVEDLLADSEVDTSTAEGLGLA